MIPDTVGALVAFLGLVAPGIVFELRRSTRRAERRESAFREISRTALTSLIFTGLSVLVLTTVGLARPVWMPDIEQWVINGRRYFELHYQLVFRTAALEVAIACSLAVAADWLLGIKQARALRSYNVLFHALRARRPANTTPWLRARLQDGTEVFGYLSAYTPEPELQNQEIALKSPLTLRTTTGDEDLDQWARVVIRGDQLAFLAITYLDKNEKVVVANDIRS